MTRTHIEPASAARPLRILHHRLQVKHAALLKQFQDPSQADQLTKIMHELEQTKTVLHETIEAALERGQKIDSLVDKSNDLSGSSKMFYKTAKKQNQCCTFM